MSKNVNNDVTMNPPVLDPFLCQHEELSWYSVNSNCAQLEQVAHNIKYRFSALNTNLHFRLSRLPAVTSTHLLPLRFEYLRRCSVTKLEPKSLSLCVIMSFFVSAQELSGTV